MLAFGANPPQPLAGIEARNTFYVRHPVRSFPHDDWLMEFQVINDSSASVSIRRLGSDEPVPPFRRLLILKGLLLEPLRFQQAANGDAVVFGRSIAPTS
ncbi:MAG: hypothetical protein R3C20_06105 [Planctomycetaceae bacterium]